MSRLLFSLGEKGKVYTVINMTGKIRLGQGFFMLFSPLSHFDWITPRQLSKQYLQTCLLMSFDVCDGFNNGVLHANQMVLVRVDQRPAMP